LDEVKEGGSEGGSWIRGEVDGKMRMGGMTTVDIITARYEYMNLHLMSEFFAFMLLLSASSEYTETEFSDQQSGTMQP